MAVPCQGQYQGWNLVIMLTIIGAILLPVLD